MRRAKEDELTLTYIHWFDASYQRGECTEDELIPEVHLHTAGILVREDRRTVSVALDKYDRDRTWRYISHIPKCNIISRQDVKLECKKAKR